ncbi:MAG: beta-lactamase family protein [Thalassovita sp.]
MSLTISEFQNATVHQTAEDLQGVSYAISGYCDPQFHRVLRAFVENFQTGTEVGAAVSVVHQGKTVVDLWGGYTDRNKTQNWSENTTVNMMSVAKGFVATAIAMLVDRGQLDYDAPVAKYWPEFAAAGKENIPLRYILDHRVGLPVLRPSGPRGLVYDWDGMTQALAQMEPLWVPGDEAGYHILSMGCLTGEVIRRVTGLMPGDFIRREITEPLKLDYNIGLREGEMDRVAEFIPAVEGTIFKVEDLPDEDLLKYAWAELPEGEDFNSRDWMMAQVPGASGHGNARAVARFYGCLAEGGALDGVRLLSSGAIRVMSAEQHNMCEQVMKRSYHQGLGVLRNSPPISPMGPNMASFGHHGVGGAVGLCDPDARLGFAYSMNQMHARVDNGPRAGRLKDAMFASVY